MSDLGVGLDVGTMFLVGSRKNEEGEVAVSKTRNVFLDLDADAKKMLKLSQVNFIERGDLILIIGDEALSVANMMKRDVRRPLSQGIISASEIDAFEVLSLIIENLLGEPKVHQEICHYSVPAEPLDNAGQDVVYHTEVFRKIITELGYTAKPMNEALAICYSECAKEMFSGLTLSFGAGMVNLALTYKTLPAMQFSLARSGDWVDGQSARAVGKTGSQMAAIKEKGVDLMNPSEGEAKNRREREAIAMYYRSLINYALDNIDKQFRQVQSEVDLPEAVPLVVSGGTSLAGSFVDLFKEVFETKKNFPIEITEIRHASDPLNAVSKGLLVASLNDDDE